MSVRALRVACLPYVVAVMNAATSDNDDFESGALNVTDSKMTIQPKQLFDGNLRRHCIIRLPRFWNLTLDLGYLTQIVQTAIVVKSGENYQSYIVTVHIANEYFYSTSDEAERREISTRYVVIECNAYGRFVQIWANTTHQTGVCEVQVFVLGE